MIIPSGRHSNSKCICTKQQNMCDRNRKTENTNYGKKKLIALKRETEKSTITV